MLIEEFNKLSNYKQLSAIFNSTPSTKVANVYGKAIEVNTYVYLYIDKHDDIKRFIIYNDVCNTTVYEFTNNLIIKAE